MLWGWWRGQILGAQGLLSTPPRSSPPAHPGRPSLAWLPQLCHRTGRWTDSALFAATLTLSTTLRPLTPCPSAGKPQPPSTPGPARPPSLGVELVPPTSPKGTRSARRLVCPQLPSPTRPLLHAPAWLPIRPAVGTGTSGFEIPISTPPPPTPFWLLPGSLKGPLLTGTGVTVSVGTGDCAEMWRAAHKGLENADEQIKIISRRTAQLQKLYSSTQPVARGGGWGLPEGLERESRRRH